MRILIADDHPLFRGGVRNLIQTTDDMEIVGEAATGEEAVDKANALRPDIVLMDIRMPGMNGVEATKKIKETMPQVHVLILTMFKDDQSVFTAMRVGARGYILKDSNEEELLQSIRMVGGGGVVFGSDVASRMMEFFSVAQMAEPIDSIYTGLTVREREILKLIADNATNAEIASKLHISVKTVANYATVLFDKLQVESRKEAGEVARNWKLNSEPFN